MLVQDRACVPAQGMQAIPDQLAEGLDVSLETVVSGIAHEAGGVVAHGSWGEARADAVVVATDPASAARLTGEAVPTEAKGVVSLHYRSPETLDAEPRILLALHAQHIAHAVWIQNVAPTYMAGGAGLFHVTVLGHPQPDDEALDAGVRHELEGWYGRRAGDLELLGIDRVPLAQVSQPPGYVGALAPIEPGRPNVVLASDASRFSSIQGAMEAGEQAAAVLTGDAAVRTRPRGA